MPNYIYNFPTSENFRSCIQCEGVKCAYKEYVPRDDMGGVFVYCAGWTVWDEHTIYLCDIANKL